MSKYEISDVTKNDLRESQRMLAQHPKILGALGGLKLKEEARKHDLYENAKTDEEREFYRFLNEPHNLKDSQRMMILHIRGQLDWNQTHLQIANKFGFSDKDIKHLSSYIKYQEIISSVIGWDRLIELIIFVIEDCYGCSIGSFANLFRKINKYPRDQWSDKMDRVIQGIRRHKPFKDILEDLGLK